MSRDRLFQLLPAALRQRDVEVGSPLAALLGLVGDQVLHLREDLRQLYDDQFIETCAEWLVPYIGDLIGHEPRHGTIPRIASPRAEVARTVGYRRRKGTAGVLQQLGQDVTGWPTRVVEVFRQLATTQHLNFPRPDHVQAPDLRRARPLLDLGTPFSTLPVRPDVREDRHQNLPDVVAYVWRLRALPLQRVTPFQVDATDPTRFTFSPLGDPVPLFSRPPDTEEAGLRGDLSHVPGPIGRRELFDRLALYYGEELSLWVRIDADIVPIHLVDAADLSDKPGATGGEWGRGARKGRIAIDPVLGRLAIHPDLLGKTLEVGFHVGALAELGGGQYERDSLGPDAAPATFVRRARAGRSLAQDLKQVLGGSDPAPILEIGDSATYPETLTTLDLGGVHLTLRAADRERPVLRLAGDLLLVGEAGGELTLDGLVITGGALVVDADAKIRRLTLRHCTFVPGRSRTLNGQPVDPTAPSVVVHAPDLELVVQGCITGPIRAVPDARVRIARSVVDAGPDGLAYAGPDGKAGGALDVDASTVLGAVHARELGLVSDTILHGLVTSDRRQTGCIRFSFLPFASSVPRRFRCQPDSDRPLAPQFTTLRYGAPAYVQLSRRTALEIRTGADDESELGVFHDLYQPHREGNLRARLDEYLRVGLRAGVFFVT